MALAVLIGSFSARRITVPLARVADATQRIAQGQRNVLIGEKTRVRELDGIASSVNDLSRALGEQEALRRRLTADMAHELRTPLATLQSHLEALIDGVWQPDAARLGGLHEEILRINRLVADHGTARPLRRVTPSLNFAATNIALLVSGIVRNHEPQFREKGVALGFASAGGDPPGGPIVAVDADKLSQAVINLLSNALKYTQRGGAVDVQVRFDASGSRDPVADTGVGIAPGTFPASSSGSTGLTIRAAARRAAPASASRLQRRSWKRTAGRSSPSSMPGQGSQFTGQSSFVTSAANFLRTCFPAGSSTTQLRMRSVS